ncbi:bifunctional enoyl-CoA hydratase/phosphate acetyltransferase [Blastochloris sulfoviridis]|uniref:Bifunctional enoyl-CoA hydratase/phosphate acetyltransferase n=1 Tax=Blastochloris sulfoviridis TaxID=50712 RepID=A0A5M6HVG6_9HYPH|nr:bifunctional enoyl-CoA hydratase/phosphate acetyltransferase [Blastochloris sulfoviridis]KAA5599549.1 bifunctional enoyl-CoA hydratase/phosphate acetyltransferase [Blastochloris sulfoviridis]
MPFIENKTYDEIAIGDSAQLVRRLTLRDIEMFAVLSGDVNPAHLDLEYAKHTVFGDLIGHGMWGAALISTVLGTQLPGPGTIYRSQTLSFSRPVKIGDRLTVKVVVTRKDPEKKRIGLDCSAVNESGETVISGTAEVVAPTVKVKRPPAELPTVRLEHRRPRLQRLLDLAADPAPVRAAIVNPVDADALELALQAAEAGLLQPVLVGRAAVIRRVAADAGLDIASFDLVQADDEQAAIDTAFALARTGKVEAIVNGSVAEDELVAAAAAACAGRGALSQIMVMDVPTYPRPLLITDTGVHVAPTLTVKRDIVQNAIDLALAIGIACPRVALLSAGVVVTPRVPSTLDAAQLCKMADRGQITGGQLDGPLSFETAVNEAAARAKGLTSPVAGNADILVVPNLEAGDMLAMELRHLADAQAAGILMGARVPIVPGGSGDTMPSRLVSCALALLVVQARTRAGFAAAAGEPPSTGG